MDPAVQRLDHRAGAWSNARSTFFHDLFESIAGGLTVNSALADPFAVWRARAVTEYFPSGPFGTYFVSNLPSDLRGTFLGHGRAGGVDRERDSQ